ncbi:MAG: hypothetical protein ABFC96_09095 [Thermoguttaceae bacterium]
MELLNALLAGFFLWLLVFQAQRNSLKRTRREAGELVLRVDASPGLRKKTWPCLLAVGLFACLVVNSIACVASGQEQPFSACLALAVLSALVLSVAIRSEASRMAVEVRDRGVLYSMSEPRGWPYRWTYAAWASVFDAKWASLPPLFNTHPRLVLVEKAIPESQRPAVSAAIGRFVPVHGAGGLPIAQPDKRRDAEDVVAIIQAFHPRRFQFDLQSLLILAVVVACLANCYGLRYRRLQPVREAMARLENCDPRVQYRDEQVWWLDFSSSPTKPGDDDLANLEPLKDLEILNLSGSPVTDAGLKHLQELKNLHHLTLTGTLVTVDGVDKLRRALPHVGIVYAPGTGPRPRPPKGPR